MIIRLFSSSAAALALRVSGLVLALSLSAARAASPPVVSSQALMQAAAAHRADVPEFQFIREQAKALGIRVWLFGGTAAGYGHYVKWDLQRKSGDVRFQPDRFDYDYTNIYRSTQDADLVVDGTPQAAEQLAEALTQRFPHLQGSKSAWEVRLLKQAVGAKDALLDNPDYLNQHTDSNSTGMIELTDPPAGKSVVRDLRDWKSPEPVFLKDLADGKLHYYFSDTHATTARAKAGDNPEIFSVVRLLTKAFQYELTLRPEDWKQVQEVIDRFDPARDLKTDYARSWIEKNGRKLIQHAVNIEYAWETLEKLGLRKKLIAIKNDADTQDSLAWWLSKEPLRDRALGTSGLTAREIFGTSAPIVLAHETDTFLSYESITRAHTGDPNILISRGRHAGETAIHGDGFYTRIGREGGQRSFLEGGTGRTIRFTLDPNAREGEDFTRAASDYVVILNKRAIRVIPESLNISIVDYFRLLANEKSIPFSERGLLEKFKRRLNALSQSLSGTEAKEIRGIVEKTLDSSRELPTSLLVEFFALSPGFGHRDRVEKIVDRLISGGKRGADEFVMSSVLNQEWSANRPDWILSLIHGGDRLRVQDLIDQVIVLPHWRDQKTVVQALVKSGMNLRETVEKVLLPYWRDRPEFDSLISGVLNQTERVHDSARTVIATQLLVLPSSAGHPEWLEKFMETTFLSHEWMFSHLLKLPHWRNQKKVAQAVIRLEMALPQFLEEVLIPEWENKPEFAEFISEIVKKPNTAVGVVARKLLVRPKYAARSDWCEAVLKSRYVSDDALQELLILPQWARQEKLVQAAIDRGVSYDFLIKKVLVPYWQDRPEYSKFVETIIKKYHSAMAVVAHEVLTLPSSASHFEWLEAVLKEGGYRRRTDRVVSELLALPHWRDQAKVVQLAIQLDYNLPQLAEQVLFPHWLGRPELSGFISAILHDKRPGTRLQILKPILAHSSSAAHPEWLEAVIRRDGISAELLEVLNLPHWRTQIGPVRATIQASAHDPRTVRHLVVSVLLPYWKQRPEFGLLLADLLAIREWERYVRSKLLEPSRASSSWIHAWIDGKGERSKWLFENVLSLPQWRSHPEFPVFAEKLIRASKEEAITKLVLALPEALQHPEWAIAAHQTHGKEWAFGLLAMMGRERSGGGDSTRVAFVTALLKEGSPGILKGVGEEVLTQPWSAAHPEWLEKVAYSVEVGPTWVRKNLLSLPHWQGVPLSLPGLKDRCLIAIRRALR